ncbi:MAG: WYL domain-containing protein [Lachnospiraceae bacterium]|nr:WYL domain-containing protein [Lachnospiraceae bacterium]
MNYLTDSEIEGLIEEIKSGNNDAWERIYHNFENYIHKCCWDILRERCVSDAECKDFEEDLYMAGWQGFVDSLKNYNPQKGKLLTYATKYINREISKELKFLLNPLGLTERPEPKKKRGSGETESTVILPVSIDDEAGISENALSYALMRKKQNDEAESEISGNDYLYLMSEIAGLLKDEEDRKEQLEQLYSENGISDLGGYSNERTTLQILEILRQTTDEKHTVSKDELKRLLRLYRIGKYKNDTSVPVDNTFNKIIAEILLELNPGEYTDENDGDYRIKYDGYTEDKLNKKVKPDKSSSQKVESGSAPVLNGLHYVHPFEYEETDRLIQLISFSDMLSVKEKEKLIGKICELTGKYYTTPYWDGKNLKFNPRAVHSRFTGKMSSEREKFAESLKTLQYAVNNLAQVRFRFNRYNADHELVPTSEYMHELSPYHLVVYHDNYYCIGLKKGDNRVWHYRVDLMSDVEIVLDEEGKIVPVRLTNFEGLPILNAAWDPEKYMAEHLNMAYDTPRDIRIKIKNTDYTIIHDWFGDHYKKVDEVTGADEEGNEIRYDIVKVRTSPSMIVHWAMQYSNKVEIMNEEIRNSIRENYKLLEALYG